MINRINTEILRRLWEDGLDDVQIAKTLGVSKQAVQQRRAEIGLPPQRHRHIVRPEKPPVIRPAPPPKSDRLSAEDTAALLATKGKWAALDAFARERNWTAVRAQIEFHRVR